MSFLRPMTQSDLEMVLQWRNDDRVRHYMLTQQHITFAEHAAWFARVQDQHNQHLFIYEENGIALGHVNFSPTHTESTVFDWGFYTAPTAPKGTGHKLGYTALNHIFGLQNVTKICGQVLNFNIRSLSFHNRLGFVKEGILRKQYHIHGHLTDMVLFGLMKDEWEMKNDNGTHGI